MRRTKRLTQSFNLPRHLQNRATEITKFLKRNPQVKSVAINCTGDDVSLTVMTTKRINFAKALNEFHEAELPTYFKLPLRYVAV